jgi:hypothetical protein
VRPGKPHCQVSERMVGATGFEPATTGPPVRCATGLRYAPMLEMTVVYTTALAAVASTVPKTVPYPERAEGYASLRHRRPGSD